MHFPDVILPLRAKDKDGCEIRQLLPTGPQLLKQ